MKRGHGKGEKHWSEVWVGFLAGVLGGILTWFATDFLALKQELVTTTSRAVDTTEFRQGPGSLAWDFALQPERRYIFSSTETVGSFVHFEVGGDRTGSINGVDFRDYYAVKFFAKASKEGLEVKEVNLFLGPDFVQYIFEGNRPLVLETRWREFTIALSGFVLAPWEAKYRGHLAAKTRKNGVIDLSNVTAFGFDQKTSSRKLVGRIWLDYFRLLDQKGTETLLSAADGLEFNYQGHRLTWVAGARRYP